MNPLIPPDVSTIREGKWSFRGSLLLADISGFSSLTGKLALQGKRGTEELSEILNTFFSSMYGIVREHGGFVLSSAGDSMLVRFPEGSDPTVCAGRMMDRMGSFGRLETIAGVFDLDIKVVIGRGPWGELVIGDTEDAHLFLAGDLVARMAMAEESALRGEIVSVSSDLEFRAPFGNPQSIPDEAFYIPGTETMPGEHRSISAIFVNVTGYDPAAPPLESITDLFLDISMTARKHGGVVQMDDNMLPGGCRIFLLFGAPRSYGNDLVHAVMAGMEIRDRIKSLSGLQARMGMDEGYAFAGVIGSSWRRHYTVIGDVVNTAAGIADSVDAGLLGVSDRVCRMSRSDFLFSEMGTVRLRGGERALRLFSPVSRRSDPVYSYGFVGRKRETHELMDGILSGGCLRLLEGEAGIGKTRFLDRLSVMLTARGITVLSGTSVEQGQTNGIFASLVGEMAGMLEGDSQSVRKSRLWNLVSDLEDSSGTLSRREAFLGRMLFSIDYPDSDYNRLPPRLRRENLIDGICDLITARPGHICVILDDLHNCTDEDLQAVEYICRKVMEQSRAEVSFILSRRPDERPLLRSGEPVADLMTLSSLDRESMDELMLDILDGSPMKEDLEGLIRSRTEGNPFYLMQFLMYLVEEGLIALQEGRWGRTEDYSDEKLPGNIFSMIMARIDRLEKQAKESLRIGSVMGLRFDEEIVRRVAGRDVHSSLSECSDAGLTYRSEIRALEFVFSHTLIKDVTYDSILRKRRKQIHGTIGSILEEMYSDDIETICPVLAYHFLTAEIWPRAVDYNIMAGEKAWSEYRNQNAIQHYQSAIGIMEDHPDGSSGRLAECYRELGRIHDRLGRYDKALEFYDHALGSVSDTAMTGDVTLLKADILYTMGQVDESLAMLDDIQEMLGGSGREHPLLLIRIECFRAWAYCVIGRIDAAMEKALEAVELSEALTGFPERECDHRRGYAYNTLATVHWGNGDYASARDYYQKALAIAGHQDMKREMAVTCGNIGLVSQKMGRLDEAVDSFRMQHSLAGEIGEKLILLTSNGSLSTAYSSLGMLDEALEAAETYRRQAEELPAMQDVLLAHNQLGIINLALGRESVAWEYAEKALSLPGSSSYERERTNSILLKSMVCMEGGDDDEAGKLLHLAEDLARGLHSKSLLMNVLTALIYHRAAVSKPEGVMEMLKEAEGLVEEMGVVTGAGRISVLRGRALLLDGRRPGSIAETENAMAIFSEHGLKPALADALDFRCSLFGPEESLTAEESACRDQIASRLEELETDMGIRTRRRSAVLQIL